MKRNWRPVRESENRVTGWWGGSTQVAKVRPLMVRNSTLSMVQLGFWFPVSYHTKRREVDGCTGEGWGRDV